MGNEVKAVDAVGPEDVRVYLRRLGKGYHCLKSKIRRR